MEGKVRILDNKAAYYFWKFQTYLFYFNNQTKFYPRTSMDHMEEFLAKSMERLGVKSSSNNAPASKVLDTFEGLLNANASALPSTESIEQLQREVGRGNILQC